MKTRKIKLLILISILLLSMIPLNVSAFEREVYNFDRIWYDSDIGFNKNGQGQLILAVTYTNNTLRNIDYAMVTYVQDPFYISFEFQDELKIIRDPEGNIIYQEPEDGFMYLKKNIVDNHFPDNIKKLASKGLNFSTIQYDGDLWYRVHVPNFNKKYEWKKFQYPSEENWYTWGSNQSIFFKTKAMFIKILKKYPDGIEFYFNHPTDNNGQEVVISKSYFASLGITKPYFEWGDKKIWKTIPYTENETCYFISPEHFSLISAHQVSSGTTYAEIDCERYDGLTSPEYIVETTPSFPSDYVDYYETPDSWGGELLQAEYRYIESIRAVVYNSAPNWLTRVNVTLEKDGGNVIDSEYYRKFNVGYTFPEMTVDRYSEGLIVGDYYWLKLIKKASDRIYMYGEKSNVFDGTSQYFKSVGGLKYPGSHTTWDMNWTIIYNLSVLPENVTRISGSSSERNIVNITAGINYDSDYAPGGSDPPLILKVPVSNSVQGITEVWNVTSGDIATEVNDSSEISMNTFWFDSSGWVWIGTSDLSTGETINWSVNCSYGATFSVSFPEFINVGEYIILQGLIKDADGDGLDGVIAKTFIYYQNGSIAIGPIEWNCTNGNFQTTISSNSLIPNIYIISIEFTDSVSGITFKKGNLLYISFPTPDGVYSNALVLFSFYNTNEALGLPVETLKIYVDGDRQYQNIYYAYTGEVINVTIKDYYNTTLYSDDFTISSTYTFLDFGLTFHSYKFCNKNDEYYMVSLLKEGGSRWWERGVCPYETVEWIIPSGNYTLRGYNSSDVERFNFTAVVNNSKVYVIEGVNLSEIIDGQSVIIDVLEQQTEYFNDSIANVTTNVTVNNTVNVTISTGELENRSIVVFSFYNTNEGLGLDRETLLIYVDDQRLIGNIFYCDNGTIFNLTIKDFYNFTLYANDFTVTDPFTFIDLGLTFHSWLFGNKNEDYYMISLLKEGASRWWERGIVPYGEREYLIPSGNYTLRIYDKDYVEVHNESYTVVNSKVFVIHGINLSEIINGQSIIRGQLLEFRGEFRYYTTPDIVRISDNPPMMFSVYDPLGMMLDEFATLICPALIVKAGTSNETYADSVNSIARIPGNDTVENGTISILSDRIKFSGSADWVNITYTDNGTLLQNTSYVPIELMLSGENITINASDNISIRRETRYQQVTKFEWLYYQNDGWGPIPDRAGWHTAGIEVKNPLNVPIYDVYVFIQFSPETTCDQDTVQVLDTDNDGNILEGGVDYDVTDKTVQFYLKTIPANSIQYYNVNYYKSLVDSYYNGEDQKSIDSYDSTVWNGKSYHYFDVNYHNPRNKIFRGGLYIKLNFNKPLDIDDESVRIYDQDSNVEIPSKNFVVGTNFIRIDNEGLGDVPPGGGRNFRVYFIFKDTPGANAKNWNLNTPFWYPLGFPVTTFMVIFLVGMGIIVSGAYYIIRSSSAKKKKAGITITAFGIFIVFIFYVLATIS